MSAGPILIPSRWRVFCPRCGNAYPVRMVKPQLEQLIDGPCHGCGQVGVGAVELRP